MSLDIEIGKTDKNSVCIKWIRNEKDKTRRMMAERSFYAVSVELI